MHFGCFKTSPLSALLYSQYNLALSVRRLRESNVRLLESARMRVTKPPKRAIDSITQGLVSLKRWRQKSNGRGLNLLYNRGSIILYKIQSTDFFFIFLVPFNHIFHTDTSKTNRNQSELRHGDLRRRTAWGIMRDSAGRVCPGET